MTFSERVLNGRALCIANKIIDCPLFTVGVLTLIGAVLRLYNLGEKSLWLDEAKLFWISQGTLHDIIIQNASSNSAPPLYALVVHGLSNFSQSETTLRAGSAIFGILAIPAMYWLARQLLNKYSAYVSTLLIAISTSQIEYSQELREYSLAFLVACLMLTSFIKYINQSDLYNLLITTIIIILGVFTQYGLALLILSFNIVILFRTLFKRRDRIFAKSRSRILLEWSLSQIAVLSAVVIVYVLALQSQFDSSGFGAESYLAGGYWNGSLSSLVELSLMQTYNLFAFAFPSPTLLLLFTAVGLMYTLRAHHWRILCLLLTPIIVTFLSALLGFYPYIGARQDFHLIPIVVLFVGLGSQILLQLRDPENSIINGKTVVLLSVLALSATGLLEARRYIRSEGEQHIRPLVDVIVAEWTPGDLVYVGCRAEPAFRYYARENEIQWVERQGATLQEKLQQVDAIQREASRLWMIFSHCSNNEDDAVISYVRDTKPVDLVRSQEGAWLYLADMRDGYLNQSVGFEE